MTVENISWSISTKECCRPRRGLNPRPSGLQSDGASKWATEAGRHFMWIVCLASHYSFLFLYKTYTVGTLVPLRGASNEYPQHMFSCRNKNNITTLIFQKSTLSGVTMYVKAYVVNLEFHHRDNFRRYSKHVCFLLVFFLGVKMMIWCFTSLWTLSYMPSLTPWGKTSRNSDISHGLTPWAVKLTESKNPIEKKS